MSNIKNTTKRYQNPELFEQLAIEYAVGSLHGRARKRFEALMDTHFYLRAVVDAYESKFANLVELLPDQQPSKRVWKNIDSHIKASVKAAEPEKEKVAWWKSSFFKQGFGMAMMTIVISAVLLFNPMTKDNTATATAYNAILESETIGIVAVTKILKSDMKLSIDMLKPMDISDDMELALWCHPKDGGIPMKMGVISKTGKTEIKISKKEWREMENVDYLEISIEHKNTQKEQKPTGKIILKGDLNTADER